MVKLFPDSIHRLKAPSHPYLVQPVTETADVGDDVHVTGFRLLGHGHGAL